MANQIAKSDAKGNNAPAKKKPAEPPRTNAQIEADLIATRERLTASVETLIDTVHPSRIKQRQVDNLKQFADTSSKNAKALIFNARGDLRKDRLAIAGAAVVGAITFLTIVGRLARRGRS